MGQHEQGFEKGLTDGNPATCAREDEKDPFAEEILFAMRDLMVIRELLSHETKGVDISCFYS